MRNRFTLASLSAGFILLLSACNLSAQATTPDAQQCWFNDPTDPDNMILAPCEPESSSSKPKTAIINPVQPSPQTASSQPKPASQAGNIHSSVHSSGPLVASGWCAIQARNAKPGNPTASSSTVPSSVVPSETTTSNHTSDHGPGCDAGLGLALYTHDRLSLVSVLGTKTLGIGLAWIVIKPTPSFPRVVALALGLVVQYDSGGIYRQVYPALGATMSFRGRPGTE